MPTTFNNFPKEIKLQILEEANPLEDMLSGGFSPDLPPASGAVCIYWWLLTLVVYWQKMGRLARSFGCTEAKMASRWLVSARMGRWVDANGDVHTLAGSGKLSDVRKTWCNDVLTFTGSTSDL